MFSLSGTSDGDLPEATEFYRYSTEFKNDFLKELEFSFLNSCNMKKK